MCIFVVVLHRSATRGPVSVCCMNIPVWAWHQVMSSFWSHLLLFLCSTQLYRRQWLWMLHTFLLDVGDGCCEWLRHPQTLWMTDTVDCLQTPLPVIWRTPLIADVMDMDVKTPLIVDVTDTSDCGCDRHCGCSRQHPLSMSQTVWPLQVLLIGCDRHGGCSRYHWLPVRDKSTGPLKQYWCDCWDGDGTKHLAPSTFSPASASHRGFALLPWHEQLGCLPCRQVLVLGEEGKKDVGQSKSTKSIDFLGFGVWGVKWFFWKWHQNGDLLWLLSICFMIWIVLLKPVSCDLFMLSSKHCWRWWTCLEVWLQTVVLSMSGGALKEKCFHSAINTHRN